MFLGLENLDIKQSKKIYIYFTMVYGCHYLSGFVADQLLYNLESAQYLW